MKTSALEGTKKSTDFQYHSKTNVLEGICTEKQFLRSHPEKYITFKKEGLNPYNKCLWCDGYDQKCDLYSDKSYKILIDYQI
jgi:DNA polymerase IIIc chi subunit